MFTEPRIIFRASILDVRDGAVLGFRASETKNAIHEFPNSEESSEHGDAAGFAGASADAVRMTQNQIENKRRRADEAAAQNDVANADFSNLGDAFEHEFPNLCVSLGWRHAVRGQKIPDRGRIVSPDDFRARIRDEVVGDHIMTSRDLPIKGALSSHSGIGGATAFWAMKKVRPFVFGEFSAHAADRAHHKPNAAHENPPHRVTEKGDAAG